MRQGGFGGNSIPLRTARTMSIAAHSNPRYRRSGLMKGSSPRTSLPHEARGGSGELPYTENRKDNVDSSTTKSKIPAVRPDERQFPRASLPHEAGGVQGNSLPLRTARTMSIAAQQNPRYRRSGLMKAEFPRTSLPLRQGGGSGELPYTESRKDCNMFSRQTSGPVR